MIATLDPRLMEIERRLFEEQFAPKPDLSLPDHARRYRVLTRDTSAVAGAFVAKPYQLEPMRALDDPEVRSVTCVMPSQVGGKTEIGLCWYLKNAHINPGPMLAVEPTLQMAKALSEERIDPMFENAFELRSLLAASGTKGKGNRIRFKRGAGWSITVLGARSAAELSMRPFRDAWCDEPDRYPLNVGGEGTVVQLVDGRMRTFPDRKRLLTGTPVYEDLANSIWVYHVQGSGGEWWVPCPLCSAEQPLVFGDRDTPFGLKWESGRPETVQYLCAHCGKLFGERHKVAINQAGSYKHERPERVTHRSFHFEAVASETISWPEVVIAFNETLGIPDKLQTFNNTIRALPWREGGVAVDLKLLQQRRMEPGEEMPAYVHVLVAGVDVQHNRLEVGLLGFGAGERSWMRIIRIEGDTSTITSPVWKDLDAVLAAPVKRADGKEMRIRLSAVDIGDQADIVSEYVRTRTRYNVRAVRGSEIEGMVEPVKRARKRNKFGIEFWLASNLITKRVLFGRLARVSRPGPGYIEFDGSTTDEMLEQFLAEKLVRQNGRRIWLKISGRANEAIDLWRYGYAALWMLGAGMRTKLMKLAETDDAVDAAEPTSDGELAEESAEPAAEPEPEKPKRPRRRRGSWLDRFRG